MHSYWVSNKEIHLGAERRHRSKNKKNKEINLVKYVWINIDCFLLFTVWWNKYDISTRSSTNQAEMSSHFSMIAWHFIIAIAIFSISHSFRISWVSEWVSGLMLEAESVPQKLLFDFHYIECHDMHHQKIISCNWIINLI